MGCRTRVSSTGAPPRKKPIDQHQSKNFAERGKWICIAARDDGDKPREQKQKSYAERGAILRERARVASRILYEILKIC